VGEHRGRQPLGGLTLGVDGPGVVVVGTVLVVEDSDVVVSEGGALLVGACVVVGCSCVDFAVVVEGARCVAGAVVVTGSGVVVPLVVAPVVSGRTFR
jgi:hypothetical protein